MIGYIRVSASGTAVPQCTPMQFLRVAAWNYRPSSILRLQERNWCAMNDLLNDHQFMAPAGGARKDYFYIHIAAL